MFNDFINIYSYSVRSRTTGDIKPASKKNLASKGGETTTKKKVGIFIFYFRV
jgi:hypothetical protein